MNAPRVLVTGGAGFVGSHLVDALIARGDDVVVLDDLSTGTRANLAHLDGHERLEVVDGSTTDAALVEALMADADACLHLASAVGVQLVVSNPLRSLLSNVRGADNVLHAAARHGVRVLFTSTSEVYGKNSDGKLDEDSDRILGSPFKSRWNYAIAKSFGEALAYSLHRDANAETIVVRLFNTVGSRQTGTYGMVLPSFVRQAVERRPVTVYGDGTQTRCFAHVADVVQAILMVFDDPRAIGRVFNIGAGVETSILELARRVVEHAGSDSEIVLVPYSEAYDEGFEELGKRAPDASLVRALTGWEPQRTVDDAIVDVIAYERARLRAESSVLGRDLSG